jgi:hypothetical protein
MENYKPPETYVPGGEGGKDPYKWDYLHSSEGRKEVKERAEYLKILAELDRDLI